MASKLDRAILLVEAINMRSNLSRRGDGKSQQLNAKPGRKQMKRNETKDLKRIARERNSAFIDQLPI